MGQAVNFWHAVDNNTKGMTTPRLFPSEEQISYTSDFEIHKHSLTKYNGMEKTTTDTGKTTQLYTCIQLKCVPSKKTSLVLKQQ